MNRFLCWLFGHDIRWGYDDPDGLTVCVRCGDVLE